MAGVYIHVPFCKTRCIYCDFFTRTDMGQKTPYIESLCREIELRADYLGGEPIDTIYFGGGTPSQLSPDNLKSVLDAVYSCFPVNKKAEITLEANPDDLSEKYLNSLIELGFNRLSMGVQSFDDDLLHFLNRRHSAQKAIQAVQAAQKAGFSNISIDLMYGLPGQTISVWHNTLEIAAQLQVQHISSYHLIYEEGTKLYKLFNEGAIKTIDEELSLKMFSDMIDSLSNAGFIHYEISNFGKEGYFSRHNSSYWQGVKYLGIGPSAHSYNRTDRSWNIASIPKYIDGITTSKPDIEEEILTDNERYNDFVLTGMRTMWGVSEEKLREQFGKEYLTYFEKNIQKHIASGSVKKEKEVYSLTRKGIFISDTVMSDLMCVL